MQITQVLELNFHQYLNVCLGDIAELQPVLFMGIWSILIGHMCL